MCDAEAEKGPKKSEKDHMWKTSSYTHTHAHSFNLNKMHKTHNTKSLELLQHILLGIS